MVYYPRTSTPDFDAESLFRVGMGCAGEVERAEETYNAHKECEDE